MSVLVERELYSQDLDEGLEKEVTWGKSFRSTRVEDQVSPVKVKPSPMCIPFDLSSAVSRCRHKKKKKFCNCPERGQRKTKSQAQLSLLERSVLTRDKYTELLSVPTKTVVKKTQSEKCFKKIKMKSCVRCYEPCPPRITQMAVPNKRLVLENWKMYQHTLSPEVLMRFDEILKSGGNLEPGEARHYFKQLRRKERKERRKRRRLLRKKKEAKKRGDMLWLKKEIARTVEAMASYIEDEPLTALNFQQMMTSNELLTYLCTNKVVRIVTRNCRCPFKKTVIEISDKLIKWMDSISFFAEILPVDSREVLEVPSLEELMEEESEEEEEEEQQESEAEEEETLFWEEGEEEMATEGHGYDKNLGQGEGADGLRQDTEEFIAEKILDKAELFEEDGEGSLFDMFQDFDEDTLEKLINILAMSSDGFLAEELDPFQFPGITYEDVLEKLKEIRDGNLLEKRKDNLLLEDRMTEWAKTNDPESVDEKVLNKIHETSTILSEFFKNIDPGQFKKKGTADETADDATLILEEIFGKSERTNLQAGPPRIPEEDEEKAAEEQMMEGDAAAGEDGQLVGDFEGIRQQDGEWIEEGEDELLSPGHRREPGERAEGEDEEEGEGTDEEEGEDEEARKRREALEKENALTEGEADQMVQKVGSELERLEALMGVIRGHKPPVTYEHQPGTICCLSLKTWAVWLVEIATHAQDWTAWITGIIHQVRHYCAIIRGDVTLPDGRKRTLPKEEWRKFVKDTEEKVVSWKAYSKHVKELSDDIITNFHGKPVNCCPKCLQDHLIKNVVTAHETLQALTEAINCADYWHRCLDRMVETTSKIAGLDEVAPEVSSLASEESYTIEIEELPAPRRDASEDSWEIEIEEIKMERYRPSECDFIEVLPVKVQPVIRDIEEIAGPQKAPMSQPKGAKGDAKNKKGKKKDKNAAKPPKSKKKR